MRIRKCFLLLWCVSLTCGAAPLHIACGGDPVGTRQGGAAHRASPSGGRDDVGHGPAIIVNAGVPGENSTELRGRFAQEIAAAKPQIFVIYIGMNDAVNDRKFVAPPVFRENVQAVLDQAREAAVTPFLVAIEAVDEHRLLQRHRPESYGTTPPNLRIQAINHELEAVARQNSVGLIRFDRVLRSAGGPGTNLSPDGVHLNTKGYGLLADAVWTGLRKVWHPGDRILCVGDSLTFGQGVRPQGAGLVDEHGRAYQTYPEQLQEHIERARALGHSSGVSGGH